MGKTFSSSCGNNVSALGFEVRARRLRASQRSRRQVLKLNKTFCYLFTQKRRLFEMIIRTHLS